jgi:hypothetical protein
MATHTGDQRMSANNTVVKTNESITELAFYPNEIIWVIDYQYVGARALKKDQVIELKDKRVYRILGKGEYTRGKWWYPVKFVS